MRSVSRSVSFDRPRGFTLIELLIGLILGLLVTAAAGGIFLSNKRVFNSTETLGRIQENGRVAFELMARDIREAAGTPCGKNIPIANLLEGPAGADYNWSTGLKGYGGAEALPGVVFGTATGQRVAGTDAIDFKTAGDGATSVSKHVPSSATIFLANTSHGFKDNDVLIICDYSQAAIFQVTGPTTPVGHVVHNTGSGTIGNSCKALSFPVDPACKLKPKDGKKFVDNAIVARYGSSAWYLGYNSRGGKSLYRKSVGGTPQEITEGIDELKLGYLVPGQSSYAAATSIVASNWGEVNAVRISLGLRAATGALTAKEIEGITSGEALGRSLSHTVTLRNRTP